MYLMWMDDSKQPITARIAAGRAAYQERFGTPPRVVLLSEQDAAGVQVEGMDVLVKSWVRKSNYLFGMSDC